MNKYNNADGRLQELGFALIECNDVAGYWVYENGESDQHVEINFDGEDWFVGSKSITTQNDWVGCPYHEHMALRYDEMKAFMDKVEELKRRYKNMYAREILFRGKMEDGGEWIFGDLVASKYICCHDENVDDEPRIGFIDVVQETVGQYTGVDDVNGAKIFEGDIIRIHNDYTGDAHPFNAVVGFTHHGQFVSWGEDDGFYCPFDIWNVPLVWWEIIGNIHDNPEMIKLPACLLSEGG